MATNGATSSSPPADDDNLSRRRSGRVHKAPQRFTPDTQSQPTAAGKRKRAADDDGDDDDDQDTSDNDDESNENNDANRAAPTSTRKTNGGATNGASNNDGDSSSDELTDLGDLDSDDEPSPSPPPVPKKSSSQSKRAKPPSTKRPKIAATKTVASLPSRPKKAVRIDVGDIEERLYVEIFGSGDSAQTVAQQWHERYQADAALAVTELINCILQCSGCDEKVTEDDINDPDHCDGRLTHLQDQYLEQHVTEYPIISKAKGTKSFRDQLVNFLHALVSLMHETDILYNDPPFMENLHRWVATMSSSSFRPFRHTATAVSLALASALAEVANVLDKRISSIEQQYQAANRGKNKAKAQDIKKNLEEANKNRDICGEYINDFFDTVFVHRYKDVEPKIRTECVEALGYWIWTLPTTFLTPEYLRYLGWMLADVVHTTRHEVLKQMLRIIKRDAQKLGHFIDRFRPRLTEMAAQDSEVSVRVAAIALTDVLRATGMLDPSEIDAIGRLIFDRDVRARKAVVGFFDACVKDVIEAKIEDLGGADVLAEVFGEVESDDYESPCDDWVVIKSLAETLAAYDAQIEEEQASSAVVIARGLEMAADLVQATVPETRISLAAQALYDRIPVIKNWESIAGYLLYDHTTSATSLSRGNATEAAVKKTLAPEPSEEIVLLEVMSAAVKLSLASSQSVESDKAKKRGGAGASSGRNDVSEQEDIAMELTAYIPRLLSKFGADPETVTIVLRLEHSLDLDVFQQLRQDSVKYEKLLDEISTQFNRHDDKRVLAEAARSLLHARQYEELEEVVDTKLAVLWENVVNSLRNFDKTCEVSSRGNLDPTPLAELSTVLMKISKLASISDCLEVFEAEGRAADSSSSAIDIIINIVHRGKFEQADPDLDDTEDEVVSFAIKCAQFYFMWKIRAILHQTLTSKLAVAPEILTRLAATQHLFSRHLVLSLSSRQTNDELRLFATGSLCDLHVLFATLRSVTRDATAEISRGLDELVKPIEPGLVPELITIFDGAERTLARKTRKTLNEPAEDEDPMDSDDDDSDALDDDDAAAAANNPNHPISIARQAAELKAERALCELAGKYVLAMTAKMLDATGAHAGKLRRRMLRNEHKLGPNLREILAYLAPVGGTSSSNAPRAAPRAARSRAPPQQPRQQQQRARTLPGRRAKVKSAALVLSDDDIEDDDSDDDADEGPTTPARASTRKTALKASVRSAARIQQDVAESDNEEEEDLDEDPIQDEDENGDSARSPSREVEEEDSVLGD